MSRLGADGAAPSRVRAAKVFTDTRIRRSADCVLDHAEAFFVVMALAPVVHVSNDEKLQILRRLDQFRHWRSLDDKRYCLVCGKIITGHQIQLMGGTRGNGPLRMICPTPRCHSIPMDWVLPTGEVLANVAIQQLARTETRALRHNRDARQNAIHSGLHKLAAWFRPPA